MVEVGGSNPPGPTKIFKPLFLLDFIFSESCVLACFSASTLPRRGSDQSFKRLAEEEIRLRFIVSCIPQVKRFLFVR